MKKWIKPILLALPMLLPLVVTNQYYVHGILCRIFIYSILVASLDLVVGFIGDISIGHAGIFAIGAYAVAILTAPPAMNASGTMTFMPQLPFTVAMLIGVTLAAGAGLLLGFPALRASGPYLAVTTIAYGLIIYTVINEQEFLTNGTKGISVAALHFGAFQFDGNRLLWVVYPAMLAVMAMKSNFAASFWGRSFEAIKFSSIAAESCGISRAYFKIAAFVISAAIAGFAGGLFTELDQYVAPNTFSLDFSVLALIALIFGGLRSTFGNVIGMALVVILPDVFTWFEDFRLLVFGILLLLALFFLPGGVAGLLKDVVTRWFPEHDDVRKRRQVLEEAAARDMSPLLTPRAGGGEAALQLEKARMRFGGLVAVNDLSLAFGPAAESPTGAGVFDPMPAGVWLAAAKAGEAVGLGFAATGLGFGGAFSGAGARLRSSLATSAGPFCTATMRKPQSTVRRLGAPRLRAGDKSAR